MKKKPALPEGAEIHVKHFRTRTYAILGKSGFNSYCRVERYMRSQPQFEPSPCGGRTEVDLVLDGIVFSGTAKCMRTDAYCYEIGRNIALGRALKAATEAGVLQ